MSIRNEAAAAELERMARDYIERGMTMTGAFYHLRRTGYPIGENRWTKVWKAQGGPVQQRPVHLA